VKNLEDVASSLTTVPIKHGRGFLINRSFGLFWTGQTVSTLGAQVTAFAIPLLAAINLHATSFEMGLLRAAEFAPFLVFTLPAGVWADLGIRRWLMIVANLVRGAFITLVPVAVFLGWLHLAVLYFVMFVMGSLKVVFEMAYQTYIPEIIERGRLVNANSKIMMSYALGQSTGPGLGGVMVELLGAPLAVLTRLGRWFGPGPFVIWSSVSAGLAAFCFPLVNRGDLSGVVALAAIYFVLSASGSAITVFAWTIRQTLTPNSMLGRMNGAFRFLVTGMMPFGALFGGWLGDSIGIRATLVVSALGLLTVSGLTRFSPLRALESLNIAGERTAEAA
jgi:hypothetical protein